MTADLSRVWTYWRHESYLMTTLCPVAIIHAGFSSRIRTLGVIGNTPLNSSMSKIASWIENPIIVLGAERSGTSVVAEMIHRWGAYAGEPEKLHAADEHAPRGYWEYLPLWDLLADLGEFTSGATWWDSNFQERMKDKASEPRYKRKALDLLGEMRKDGKPWFLERSGTVSFSSVLEAVMGRPPLCRHDSTSAWHGSLLAANHYARPVGGGCLVYSHESSTVAAHDDADTGAHERGDTQTLCCLRRGHTRAKRPGTETECISELAVRKSRITPQ